MQVSICDNKYRGSAKYADHFEFTNPGHLHYLYRDVVNVKRPKAGLQEFVCIMNSNSSVSSDTHLTISINRLQVNNWFTDNMGSEISALERPIDSKKIVNYKKNGISNIMA